MVPSIMMLVISDHPIITYILAVHGDGLLIRLDRQADLVVPEVLGVRRRLALVGVHLQ
jgi:hypothetical protein